MLYETRILKPMEFEIAARLLQEGECVAFPTETVYGLGANALDEKAVAKIYLAKGRPSDNPLIVHCHHQDQAAELTLPWTRDAQRLMDQFWPGPLTLILPKNNLIPMIVTGGLNTVALRIPNHPVALNLIRAARLPVAAPSANISGKPSPTRAEHVWQDLAGKIPAIIDGGAAGWGLESTVLDCTARPFRLLRPGGITVEQLREFVPVKIDSGVFRAENEKPRSPGMKYKHYSPDAQVVLVEGDNIQNVIREQAVIYGNKGLRVAVMAFQETMDSYSGTYILELGSRNNLDTAAARIYHLLREADALSIDVVFAEGLSDVSLGLAIMNRLRKAAGKIIIT